MPLIRTFVSHASTDKSRVHDLLRQVAPYGVRPWIDTAEVEVGSSLTKALRDGVQQECQSFSLFLSKDSVRSSWVDKEVEWALELRDRGLIGIPILLDPREELTLSDPLKELLRQRGTEYGTVWLDAHDPKFAERYCRAVLRAGGAVEAKDVALHLGHWAETRPRDIPAAWADVPTIDLRLDHQHSHRDVCPTADEWQRIRAGLRGVLEVLRQVETIDVCGFAPLGVGAAVGQTFDRGGPVRAIRAWNRETSRIWETLTPERVAETHGWSPETSSFVTLKSLPVGIGSAEHIVVLFIAKDDQARQAEQWASGRGPIIRFCPPKFIQSEREATEVLAECYGAIQWLLRSYEFLSMDLITTMPLAMVPLLTHHMRQCRSVRFHDWVKSAGSPKDAYRLAVEW